MYAECESAKHYLLIDGFNMEWRVTWANLITNFKVILMLIMHFFSHTPIASTTQIEGTVTAPQCETGVKLRPCGAEGCFRALRVGRGAADTGGGGRCPCLGQWPWYRDKLLENFCLCCGMISIECAISRNMTSHLNKVYIYSHKAKSQPANVTYL